MQRERTEVWPEDFPDQCPPAEAVIARGEVYRLIDGDAPTLDDFASAYTLKPARFHGEEEGVLCMSMGLSVCGTLDDIRRTKTIGPLRKKHIALGSIDGSGVQLDTPARDKPTHQTWWRPATDTCWTGFKVVE